MDWLRISLLIFGVVLVAGIWIAHRMRVRARREGRESDFDDWGDDTAVHIRAHRDDPDIEPVLGEGIGGLDNLLEPEERPVGRRPPRVAVPAAGNEGPRDAAAPEPMVRPPREPEPEVAPTAEPAPGPDPEPTRGPSLGPKRSRHPARPESGPVSSRETEAEPEVESGPERGPGPKPGSKLGPKPGSRALLHAMPLVAQRARAKAASAFADLKQRVAGTETRASGPRAGAADAQSSPARPAAERFDDVSEPRVVGRNPLSWEANREKILVLHVVAPRHRPFTGVALGAALRRAGLALGEMSIYHYREEGDPPHGDPLFSAANMVPPGTLGDDDLADMMTPGVTLFLQLHVCDRPQRAFEVLLETAHVLARDLGGRVLDAQQSTATNQTLAHMREDMNQWLLRQRPDLLRRKAAK
ncbi:MAG: cell division protein ZipA [Thioalkalivibrio sp.]|nr:MAG: cell division protein ZipA [Thioalkalivibrio sp.]